MRRALWGLFAIALQLVVAAVWFPALRTQLLPLVFAVGALFAFVAILAMQGARGSSGFRLRWGAVGDIPEMLGRALMEYVGHQFVAGGRASLNFASINAGLQERLTITCTGALLGDFVQVAPETDIEAGLALGTPFVSAADTVTVTMVNNTAGAIDPAACVYRAQVTRETKR